MTDSNPLAQARSFSRLFCNVDSQRPEIWQLEGYQLAFHSRACREYQADAVTQHVNEDSAAVVLHENGSGIVAVADGMGGHVAGAQASAIAVEAMVESVATCLAKGRLLRTAIINGFEQANSEVQRRASGAGTTLAVAELGDGFVRPYHCGDSIVMLTGNRGKLKLLTTSHSPVGMAVEAGFLDEDEAMHHPDRHVISNAIGNAEMRIEIGSAVRFAGRDTLLLSSDGLTDNLSIREIIQRIRRGPLAGAVKQLTEDCVGRMQGGQGLPCKPDDLTLVAVRCKPVRRSETAPSGSTVSA